jgi:hypothetical protein
MIEKLSGRLSLHTALLLLKVGEWTLNLNSTRALVRMIFDIAKHVLNKRMEERKWAVRKTQDSFVLF